MVKSRVNAHERTMRELKLTAEGLRIGVALDDFEAVLTGLPSYHGRIAMLPDSTRPTDAA
jgi:circadian clock protein KaiC